MKQLYLTETEILTVLPDASVAAEASIHYVYRDSAGKLLPRVALVLIPDNTATQLLPAPPAGGTYIVKEITIHNPSADTDVDIVLRITKGSAVYRILQATVDFGTTWSLTEP